jgi:hypothetical protein
MSDDQMKAENASRMPTLTMDWEVYGHFLDGSDLSEAEKRELIEAMWSIVIGFVDLGFAVRLPDQVCGQDEEAGTDEPGDVVGSLVDHWNDVTKVGGVEHCGPRPGGRTP